MKKILIIAFLLFAAGCSTTIPSAASGKVKIEVSDEESPCYGAGCTHNYRVEVSQITDSSGNVVFDYNRDIKMKLFEYHAEIPQGTYSFHFRCGISIQTGGGMLTLRKFSHTYTMKAGKLYKLTVLIERSPQRCDAVYNIAR